MQEIQTNTPAQRSYSTEDNEMWAYLYDRQLALAQEHACTAFLDGLERLDLPKTRAIGLVELNEQVSALTNWRFISTPGAMKTADIFRCFSKRKFPLNLAMRTPQERDFAELPDLFHDLFGHGPILMNPDVAAIYEEFGLVAQRHASDAAFVKTLGHLFWFTMEVGVIRENGGVKAYGAALLTSLNEISNVVARKSDILPLDLSAVTDVAYAYREVQQSYFATESFGSVSHLLSQLDSHATATKKGGLN